MPTARLLKLAVLVLVISMAAANYGVAYLSRNSVPRQLLNSIHPGDTIGVLGLGNSLMEAAFVPESVALGMNTASPVHKNAGLGSTEIIDHLLIGRHALRQAAHIDWLVYGFSGRLLTERTAIRNSSLVGNLALRYYVEPDIVSQYANFPPADRYAFEIYRRLPLLRERGTLWSKVELFRRRIGEWGLPRAKTNRFGRVEDFTSLQPASIASFDASLRSEIAADAPVNPGVVRILTEARAAGARTAVISMPVTDSYRRDFYSLESWRAYEDQIRRKIESMGAVWIDAAGWVNSSAQFSDAVHLAPSGGETFSRRLGETLSPLNPRP